MIVRGAEGTAGIFTPRQAADVSLRNWHFTLDDSPYLDTAYVSWLKSTYVGLWYRRDNLSPRRLAHVAPTPPPTTQWLCLAGHYGTTNPLDVILVGLGVASCLYAVAEWRWDSRLEGRQLTDVEYSRKLRDWLHTVSLPASNLTGPQP